MARRAGSQKNEKDMLWKLCAEKKKNGAPEADVKYLTHELANVCTAQKKDVVEKQYTKDAVAAMEDAEKQIIILTEKPERVKTHYAQKLLVRRSEVDNLNLQLISVRQ